MKHCIKAWDEAERPREKLVRCGCEALSKAELLAILIQSGTRRETAVDVARHILSVCDSRLDKVACLSIKDLTAIEGIGTAKAVSICAAFELGRRLSSELPEEQITILRSETVFRMMHPRLGHLDHEECWMLYLNAANKLTGREKISSGGVTSTVLDPKFIAKRAMEALSSGIVLVHNHPSGNPNPSRSDIEQTSVLREVLKTCDIKLLDHIIIGKQKYYSFAEGNC